jgi:hypothetical protein
LVAPRPNPREPGEGDGAAPCALAVAQMRALRGRACCRRAAGLRRRRSEPFPNPTSVIRQQRPCRLLLCVHPSTAAVMPRTSGALLLSLSQRTSPTSESDARLGRRASVSKPLRSHTRSGEEQRPPACGSAAASRSWTAIGCPRLRASGPGAHDRPESTLPRQAPFLARLDKFDPEGRIGPRTAITPVQRRKRLAGSSSRGDRI